MSKLFLDFMCASTLHFLPLYHLQFTLNPLCFALVSCLLYMLVGSAQVSIPNLEDKLARELYVIWLVSFQLSSGAVFAMSTGWFLCLSLT